MSGKIYEALITYRWASTGVGVDFLFLFLILFLFLFLFRLFLS